MYSSLFYKLITVLTYWAISIIKAWGESKTKNCCFKFWGWKWFTICYL